MKTHYIITNENLVFLLPGRLMEKFSSRLEALEEIIDTVSKVSERSWLITLPLVEAERFVLKKYGFKIKKVKKGGNENEKIRSKLVWLETKGNGGQHLEIKISTGKYEDETKYFGKIVLKYHESRPQTYYDGESFFSLDYFNKEDILISHNMVIESLGL